MKTISGISILAFCSCISGQTPMPIPECGSTQEKQTVEGLYQLKTVCSSRDIWVAEYLDGKRHGLERIYTLSKVLIQSSNFRHGEYHGTSIKWDSNGVKLNRRNFKDGQSIGGDTGWFANGKIESVAHYDSTGTPDGYWFQRYDEGNLRYEQHWTAGACTSHVEYYRNGKVRIRMSSPISSKDALFGKAVTSAESYTWSGKLIEKVVKGNGKVYLLPKDFNDFRFEYDSEKPVVGFIEVYKDTALVKVHQIDSATILKYR